MKSLINGQVDYQCSGEIAFGQYDDNSMNVLAILTKNRSPKMLALLNPDNPNAHSYALQAQAAADALGLRLQVLTAHAEADLDNEAAFGIMVQRRAEAGRTLDARSSSRPMTS